ncbi:MAG: hypothetical protein N0A16_01460 [Blastocatellia bacterium]|nr:hypothetical protein [Blastocatellia bacterium]MCS7156379.1 hypothetical protein [Blastocatellia bacterium]MCX7751270.1 hypothetical protein [Blastocatellia bacterium]MDW8168982.1 zinc ribbon domain-containing protein [Acidobacteriota bacterium]MDW8256742.1 zinc ribbon domain-containing protein [Acidobacteriota bacterium]
MRICERCRAVVGADWRFCRYCGARLESSPSTKPEIGEELETAILEPRKTAPAYLPPEIERVPLDAQLDRLEKPRRRFQWLAFLLVGVLALGAVSSAGVFLWHEVVRHWVAPTRFSAHQSAEFSRRLTLPFDSDVALANTNGNVTIRTWDEPMALITARKRGRSARDLDDARIEITERENGLRIQTVQPDGSEVAVDYEITLPRRVRLSDVRVINGHIRVRDVEGFVRARAVNGRIELEGIAGAVEAETVNGRIEVALARCADERGTILQSINGRLTLRLPEICDARLEAETLRGEIVADDELGLTRSTERSLGQRAEGQLGRGGPLIRVRAVNGAIRLEHQMRPSAEEGMRR